MLKILEKNDSEYTLNERMYFGLTSHTKFARYGALLLFVSLVIGYIFWFQSPDTFENDVLYCSLLGTVVVYIILSVSRRKNLRKIIDEYVRQNYFLTLQTLMPEGKNSLEKFMSLAQNVFPTIKKEFKKYSDGESDWVNKHDKLDGEYKFDISLETDYGKFLLKYFPDGVKFKDVEKLVKIAKRYYNDNKVLRFVILAKKYDDIFYSDELNNKMELLIPSKPIKFKTLLSSGQTKKWILLDLILERENGYTIIWLD